MHCDSTRILFGSSKMKGSGIYVLSLFFFLFCSLQVSASNEDRKLFVDSHSGLADLNQVISNRDPKELKKIVTLIFNTGATIPTTTSGITSGIKNISPMMSQMRRLKFLHFAHLEGLRKLPEGLRQLTSLNSLEVLLCQNLGEEGLPDWIGELKNLKNLRFIACNLRSLPNSIGDLKQLKDLDLEWNQLTGLPEGVNRLRKLKTLDLCHNKISSLSPSIAELPHLKLLLAMDNPLLVVPETFWKALRYKNFKFDDIDSHRTIRCRDKESRLSLPTLKDMALIKVLAERQSYMDTSERQGELTKVLQILFADNMETCKKKGCKRFPMPFFGYTEDAPHNSLETATLALRLKKWRSSKLKSASMSDAYLLFWPKYCSKHQKLKKR